MESRIRICTPLEDEDDIRDDDDDEEDGDGRPVLLLLLLLLLGLSQLDDDDDALEPGDDDSEAEDEAASLEPLKAALDELPAGDELEEAELPELPLLPSQLDDDDDALEPSDEDRPDDARLLLSALESNDKDDEDDDDDDDDDGKPALLLLLLLLSGTQEMSPSAATVPSGSNCSETSSRKSAPMSESLLPSIWKVTEPEVSAVNCTQYSPHSLLMAASSLSAYSWTPFCSTANVQATERRSLSQSESCNTPPGVTATVCSTVSTTPSCWSRTRSRRPDSSAQCPRGRRGRSRPAHSGAQQSSAAQRASASASQPPRSRLSLCAAAALCRLTLSSLLNSCLLNTSANALS